MHNNLVCYDMLQTGNFFVILIQYVPPLEKEKLSTSFQLLYCTTNWHYDSAGGIR
jgi:erythromycin esterase-like protein